MGRKNELEFYNNTLLEERLTKIKHISNYKPNIDEDVDICVELFRYIEDLYVAFNTEKNKYVEYSVYNVYNHYDRFTKNNSSDYCKLSDDYLRSYRKDNKFYLIRNYTFDVLRLRDFNEQCKNHINLNRLKKTRIPNDVIDNIIKYFL